MEEELSQEENERPRVRKGARSHDGSIGRSLIGDALDDGEAASEDRRVRLAHSMDDAERHKVEKAARAPRVVRDESPKPMGFLSFVGASPPVQAREAQKRAAEPTIARTRVATKSGARADVTSSLKSFLGTSTKAHTKKRRKSVSQPTSPQISPRERSRTSLFSMKSRPPKVHGKTPCDRSKSASAETSPRKTRGGDKKRRSMPDAGDLVEQFPEYFEQEAMRVPNFDDAPVYEGAVGFLALIGDKRAGLAPSKPPRPAESEVAGEEGLSSASYSSSERAVEDIKRRSPAEDADNVLPNPASKSAQSTGQIESRGGTKAQVVVDRYTVGTSQSATDFGSSRPTQRHSGQPQGFLQYLPEEHALGGAVDVAVDVAVQEGERKRDSGKPMGFLAIIEEEMAQREKEKQDRLARRRLSLPPLVRIFITLDCAVFKTVKFGPDWCFADIIEHISLNNDEIEGRSFYLCMAESTLSLSLEDNVSLTLANESMDPALQTQKLFFTAEAPPPLNPSPEDLQLLKKGASLSVFRRKKPDRETLNGVIADGYEEDARFVAADERRAKRDAQIEKEAIANKKVSAKALERLGIDVSARKVSEKLGEGAVEALAKPGARGQQNQPAHHLFYETRADKGECLNMTAASSSARHRDGEHPCQISERLLQQISALIAPILLSLSRLGPEAMGAAYSDEFEDYQCASAVLSTLDLADCSSMELCSFFANIYHCIVLHMCIVDPSIMSSKTRAKRVEYLRKCTYQVGFMQYTPWDIRQLVFHCGEGKSFLETDSRSKFVPKRIPPLMQLGLSMLTCECTPYVLPFKPGRVRRQLHGAISRILEEHQITFEESAVRMTCSQLKNRAVTIASLGSTAKEQVLEMIQYLKDPDDARVIEDAILSGKSCSVRFRQFNWSFKVPLLRPGAK